MLYQPLQLTYKFIALGRNRVTVSNRRVVQNYSSAELRVTQSLHAVFIKLEHK